MKRKKHPQNEQTRREAGLPGVSKEIRGGAAKRLPSYGMRRAAMQVAAHLRLRAADPVVSRWRTSMVVLIERAAGRRPG